MQRMLGVLTAGLLMGAFAVTGWCAYQYVGPYAWIAEAQLAAFGSYEVQITFLLTLLSCLVPVLFVVVPLRALAARAEGDGEAFRTAQRNAELEHWIQHNRGSLVLGIVSALTFLAAGYFAVDALSMGDRTELDVAALEAGAAPTSRYVILRGTLRHDLITSMTEEHTTRVYVPVVRTTPSQPVVFLETYDTSLDLFASELSTGQFEGVLYENGLPGMIREQYAASGLLPARHYTLDYRRTPEDRWEMATICIAISLIAGLVLAAIRVVVWMRR